MEYFVEKIEIKKIYKKANEVCFYFRFLKNISLSVIK